MLLGRSFCRSAFRRDTIMSRRTPHRCSWMIRMCISWLGSWAETNSILEQCCCCVNCWLLIVSRHFLRSALEIKFWVRFAVTFRNRFKTLQRSLIIFIQRLSVLLICLQMATRSHLHASKAILHVPQWTSVSMTRSGVTVTTTVAITLTKTYYFVVSPAYHQALFFHQIGFVFELLFAVSDCSQVWHKITLIRTMFYALQA